MSAGVAAHYRNLLDTQRAVAEACIANQAEFASFTKSHNFLLDLDRLRQVIAARPEVRCLDLATQEYQYGLFALLGGSYRHAFGSLRLSFELLLATIYFSAHEVKLHQWLNGSRDLRWGELMDHEKGVFSGPFVKAFSPRFVDLRGQFLGLAGTVYRECSEFVHGNPNTHKDLAGPLQFREDLLAAWNQRADVIRLCSLYCFLFRYSELLTSDQKNLVEGTFLDAFGDEESIQAYFDEGAHD